MRSSFPPAIILCAYLGQSCSHKEFATTLRADHLLKFETGAVFHTGQSGTFIDGIGEEVFYFSDPMTHKRVRVMRQNGGTVMEVPLKSIVDSIGPIEDLIMVDWNRILCFIYPQDQIVETDSTGKIKKVHDLNEMIKNERGDEFNLTSPLGQMQLHNEALFFGLDWRKNNSDPDLNWQGEERPAFLRNWYARKNSSENLARVHLPAVGPAQVELGLDSFYFHLTGRIDLNTAELAHVWRIGDRLFAGSEFSDRILVVDPTSLAVTDTLFVHQPGSELGVALHNHVEHDALTRAQRRQLAFTSGQIHSMAYDRSTGAYLVFVLPQVPVDAPEEQWGWNRPFFVHIYDKQLNGPIAIHRFEGTQHNINDVLSTAAGIYIGRKTDREQQAHGRLIFDHFTFHAE